MHSGGRKERRENLHMAHLVVVPVASHIPVGNVLDTENEKRMVSAALAYWLPSCNAFVCLLFKVAHYPFLKRL